MDALASVAMVPSASGADSRQATTVPSQGPIGRLFMVDIIVTTPAVFTIARRSIKGTPSTSWCANSISLIVSAYDLAPTGQSRVPEHNAAMRKLFTLLTFAACVLAFLILAPTAPVQSLEAEAKVIALAQQLKLTLQQEVEVLPRPQGRGAQIRGDQERSFAFRNAEDEATPCHPQRKRAGVAENS